MLQVTRGSVVFLEFVTRQALDLHLQRCLESRTMPDCFLYLGQSGADKWMRLNSSEDFPVVSRLTRLLMQNLDDICDRLPSGLAVVSLGVGNGEKERLLLDSPVGAGFRALLALDVSIDLLQAAMRACSRPERRTGVAGLIEQLGGMRRLWQPPALVCLLGNSFCNYEPEFVLNLIDRNMEPGDFFLVDFSLMPTQQGVPDPAAVQQAYGCGLNAEFNLGPLLERGMAASDGCFTLELATVVTPWGSFYRTSKRVHLKNEVHLSFDRGTVHLRKDERIELGFTYKYLAGQILDLFSRGPFHVLYATEDAAEENMLVLVEKRKA